MADSIFDEMMAGADADEEAKRRQAEPSPEEEEVEEVEDDVEDEEYDESDPEYWRRRAEEAERSKQGVLNDLISQRQRNREAEERLAKMYERFSGGEQSKDDDPAPIDVDPDQDPAEYLAQFVRREVTPLREKLDQLSERAGQYDQMSQAQQAQAQVMQWANQHVTQTLGHDEKKLSDYQDRVRFAAEKLAKLAEAQGQDPNQVIQATAGSVLHRAYNSGGAETIPSIVRRISDEMGYNPGAKGQTQTSKPKRTDYKSLSGGSGSSKSGRRINKEEMLKLPNDQFEKVWFDDNLREELMSKGHVYL